MAGQRFVIWRFLQMHWRGAVFFATFPAARAVGAAVDLARGDFGQASVGVGLVLLLGLLFAWPALLQQGRARRGEVSQGVHSR